MSRWISGGIALALAGSALVGVSTASAAPTTQIVEGDVLRLVSVADWDAASSLRPGEQVRWDVTVSAEAPDPGVVRVGVSARGDADLIVDAQMCSEAWSDTGCPAVARTLRSEWSIPRDDTETALLQIPDTEIAHLRLMISLDGATGSTDMRVHAAGAGESVVIGQDGELATTGMPPLLPWVFGGGMLLIVFGLLVGGRRRRADASGGTS